MSSWLFCASLLFAVGPVVDPIDGEYLTPEDRDILPAARHLGAAADLWMVGIVNMQSSGAGIELFDSLMLGAHGRSWTQLSYYINGIDQTDPARPGMPLFDVPHLAWDWIAFNSLWTDAPGFSWQFDPASDSPARVRVAGSFGGEIGGPVWVPRGVFDRDPASDFGAPVDRRALRMARELTASTQLQVPWGALRVFGELISHDHHYLTLSVPDLADRETVMMATRIDKAPWPIDVTAGWQRRHRDHEGAQARWPEAFTQDNTGETVFAQVESGGSLGSHGILHLAVGGGWRRDQSTAHGTDPWVQDLANAWLTQLRPTYPGVTERWHMGAEARWASTERAPLQLYLRSRFAGVRREPDVVGGRAGVTYAEHAVSQTVYVSNPGESIWLRNVRAGLDWTLPLQSVWVQFTAGADFSAVGDPVRGMRLGQWGPALGVAARWPVGGGELFGLVRREPEAVTAQVGDFLSPDTPSGSVVAWSDNGDGIPTAGEQGLQLGRTGGAFHALDSNLMRPSSNAVAVGYRTPMFGPFRFTISGVGRWLLDRYTVDAPNVSTTPVAFHDPGGDGRGEVRAPEGGQDFAVGAVTPAAQSHATFTLANAEKLSYYLGLETSLVTEGTRWWFVNLGATAYLSAGGAPFGNGLDRNDPGIVDESSAGFNNAFKNWSRYDHDRSFAVKLMTGIVPVEGLSLAIAARYRDGQPFTRIVVDADLPQGATPLMAIRRGGSRYTFHMTWDLRVRYMFTRMAPFYVTAWADLFNVFNSGTELLEDPRTGPTYRRSIESVPGRAGLLTLELGWL